jgi:hypothetical protein
VVEKERARKVDDVLGVEEGGCELRRLGNPTGG